MLFMAIFTKRSIFSPLDPEEVMAAISKNDVDRGVVHETVCHQWVENFQHRRNEALDKFRELCS
jgi:hypothetical protein